MAIANGREGREGREAARPSDFKGTGVVFGMTIATAVGLFLIPGCYVFVQQIIERGGKKAPAPDRAPAPANATH